MGWKPLFFAFLAIVTPRSCTGNSHHFAADDHGNHFCVAIHSSNTIAEAVGMRNHFILLLGVLLCDTLVVIPFAYLRATGKPVDLLP